HGGWWEVGTTINLKTRWRLLEIALQIVEAKKHVFKCGWCEAWGSWREALQTNSLGLASLQAARGAAASI
ncbi:hypothetical protein A2U01_0100872, partial [Trifolium medium]|nr:hypothetical protein [Trifolium medium]